MLLSSSTIFFPSCSHASPSASSSWILFLLYPPVTSCVAVELMWDIKITLMEFPTMYCHLSAKYYHGILFLQKKKKNFFFAKPTFQGFLWISHCLSTLNQQRWNHACFQFIFTDQHSLFKMTTFTCHSLFTLSYSRIYNLCSDLAVSHPAHQITAFFSLSMGPICPSWPSCHALFFSALSWKNCCEYMIYWTTPNLFQSSYWPSFLFSIPLFFLSWFSVTASPIYLALLYTVLTQNTEPSETVVFSSITVVVSFSLFLGRMLFLG